MNKRMNRCPFCSGYPMVVEVTVIGFISDKKTHRVTCSCGAQSVWDCNTVEEVKEKWNKQFLNKNK